MNHRIACALFAAVALLVAASSAAAKPPLLVEARSAGNLAQARWLLPSGVQSQFYEVASDPQRSTFGNFLQRNLVRFGVLDAKQTCMVDDGPPLSTGTYYVHVAGHDTAPDSPQIEFSNTMKITVPGTGSCPAGGGGGGGGGGSIVQDLDKPSCSLRYSRRQDVDRLSVRARTNEAGTLSATAVVLVGPAKVVGFKSVSKTAPQNKFTRLALKLANKDKRTVKRALRRKKRLRARLLVTARDKAGNEQNRRVTVYLTR
jgi:hypothetical protein